GPDGVLSLRGHQGLVLRRPEGPRQRCRRILHRQESRHLEVVMRNVIGGLIQMSNPVNDAAASVAKIRDAMLDKHLPLINEAGKRGVQILCLQEIFNGPYFCPSQDAKWCDIAEPIPGPTIELMQGLAKKHGMAIIVPIYEREMAGVYYNSAAVI